MSELQYRMRSNLYAYNMWWIILGNDNLLRLMKGSPIMDVIITGAETHLDIKVPVLWV